MSQSQPSSQMTTIQDIITEEPSPAYSPYPTAGEQTLSFGPNRPWGTVGPAQVPMQQQQPQVIYVPATPYGNPSAATQYTTNQINGYPPPQGNQYSTPVFYNTTPNPPNQPQQQPLTNLASQIHYPPGYMCRKCHNTGYKRPGVPCKKCWEVFGPSSNLAVLSALQSASTIWSGNNRPSSQYPPQNYHQSPSSQQIQVLPGNVAIISTGGGYTPFINGGMPSVGSSGNVVVVKPGDAIIGGHRCNVCRGTGIVSGLLDQRLCTRCHGAGRYFN